MDKHRNQGAMPVIAHHHAVTTIAGTTQWQLLVNNKWSEPLSKPVQMIYWLASEVLVKGTLPLKWLRILDTASSASLLPF